MQPIKLKLVINNEYSSLYITYQNEYLRCEDDAKKLFTLSDCTIYSAICPSIALKDIFIRGCVAANDDLPMFTSNIYHSCRKKLDIAVFMINSMNSYAVYPPFIVGLKTKLRWSECNQ